MKYKSPSDCGLSKEHDYLGHFKNPKHLDRGHNSNPIRIEDGPPENRLKGDEPLFKEMDDSVDILKNRDMWQKIYQREVKEKDIRKKTDAYAEELRKKR